MNTGNYPYNQFIDQHNTVHLNVNTPPSLTPVSYGGAWGGSSHSASLPPEPYPGAYTPSTINSLPEPYPGAFIPSTPSIPPFNHAHSMSSLPTHPVPSYERKISAPYILVTESTSPSSHSKEFPGSRTTHHGE